MLRALAMDVPLFCQPKDLERAKSGTASASTPSRPDALGVQAALPVGELDKQITVPACWKTAPPCGFRSRHPQRAGRPR